MWNLFDIDENGKKTIWFKMVDEQTEIEATLAQTEPDDAWRLTLTIPVMANEPGCGPNEKDKGYFDLAIIPDNLEIALVFTQANKIIKEFAERIMKRFSAIQPREKSNFRY